MHQSSIKVYLHKFAPILELVGALLVSFHIWISVEDLDDAKFTAWPKWLSNFFLAYQNLEIGSTAATFLGIIVGVLLYATGFIGRMIRSPKDWNVIQYILDKAQKIAYPENTEDPMHHHRVTLFRRQRWAWVDHHTRSECSRLTRWCWPWGKLRPWSGWLVPVQRSGHTSKKTKTRFAAQENGQSEGISGLAWATDSAQVIRNLPTVKKSNSSNRRAYAEATCCPRSMVDCLASRSKESPPLPCSIGAVPIKVSGRTWGVLVFDSRNPLGVSENIADDFAVSIGAIEQLLEKG